MAAPSSSVRVSGNVAAGSPVAPRATVVGATPDVAVAPGWLGTGVATDAPQAARTKAMAMEMTGAGNRATPRRSRGRRGRNRVCRMRCHPFLSKVSNHCLVGDRTCAACAAFTVAGLCRNLTGFATRQCRSEVVAGL